MFEVGDYIIITRKEYEEYEERARIIQKQKSSKVLNMRLRFPYYIPEPEEVLEHMNIPLKQILPYYIYLTTMDDNGDYLIEPDNKTLNETRETLMENYQAFIYIVEDEDEMYALIKKLNHTEEDY